MTNNFFSLKLYEENRTFFTFNFDFKQFFRNYFRGEHYIYNKDFFESIKKN